MADDEKVRSETQDEGALQPVITIGHDANGKFGLIAHGSNALQTLAYLMHAQQYVLNSINPNKPRKIVGVAGAIPGLRDGAVRRPH